MSEGVTGVGEDVEAAGAEVASFDGVGAVCALHAQAIASPPRINRGNIRNAVRPTIIMRSSSVVQGRENIMASDVYEIARTRVPGQNKLVSNPVMK
jgi:hypothetical protein